MMAYLAQKDRPRGRSMSRRVGSRQAKTTYP